MAFGDQEGDVQLAFQRLEKSSGAVGCFVPDVVFSNVYPLMRAAEEKAGRIAGEFFRASGAGGDGADL